MENEIIMDEIVEMEPVKDATTGASGKGLLILGVVTVTLGAGYVLAKKVIIPAIKKHKIKKEEQKKYAKAHAVAAEDDAEFVEA